MRLPFALVLSASLVSALSGCGDSKSLSDREASARSRECAEASRFVMEMNRAFSSAVATNEEQFIREATKAYEAGKYWRRAACTRVLPEEFAGEQALR
jgi:hypothetical protein